MTGIKIEDTKKDPIKIGNVFKSNRHNNRYAKIFKIVKSTILYEIFDSDCTSSMQATERNLSNFKEWYDPIDKVPPKIVEIEEEVDVFISNVAYKNVSRSDATYVHNINLTLDKHGLIDSCGMKATHQKIGTIKRKVTKELNFNWDTYEYE